MSNLKEGEQARHLIISQKDTEHHYLKNNRSYLSNTDFVQIEAGLDKFVNAKLTNNPAMDFIIKNTVLAEIATFMKPFKVKVNRLKEEEERERKRKRDEEEAAEARRRSSLSGVGGYSSSSGSSSFGGGGFSGGGATSRW